MANTTLETARLHASLLELMRAGSPVDLAVATNPLEKRNVEIEQVGGVHDSALFELRDGRAGFRAAIAVTNQTSRGIDVVEIELQSGCMGSDWDWLTPQQIRWRDQKKNRYCGYQAYVFPGNGGGLQLQYDDVLNHLLLEHGRLPSKRRLEGWLLAVGGPMPMELRHGQWLDLSLAIIGADHMEYAETIRLWTERLEPMLRKMPPRTGLFEQAEKDAAVRPRQVAQTAVWTDGQNRRASYRGDKSRLEISD